MTEEEKEAIEIQDSINILKYTDLDVNTIDSIDLLSYNLAVKIVLNLVEKQQKEIEELKNINKMEYISRENVAHNYISLYRYKKLKQESIPKSKIEKKLGNFKYEYEKAKRNNDIDRADFYWDLYRNFTKLLESEE